MGKHDDDYKPDPNFLVHKNKKKDIFMGVELETDMRDADYDDDDILADALHDFSGDIYCKGDGSLSSEGVEIVTHPATIGYHRHRMDWPEICAIAKRHGYRSSDISSCGIHIHVNRNNLSKLDCIKLGFFFNTYRSFIAKVTRRRNNTWARLTTKKLKNYGQSRRYEAVNFRNSETVEIRAFKGTLNPDTILASLEFTHSLVKFVKQAKISEVIKRGVTNYMKYAKKRKHRYTYLFEYFERRNIDESIINNESTDRSAAYRRNKNE